MDQQGRGRGWPEECPTPGIYLSRHSIWSLPHCALHKHGRMNNQKERFKMAIKYVGITCGGNEYVITLCTACSMFEKPKTVLKKKIY